MMDTLVVIGLGLIGGSFSLGLKQKAFKRVVGYDLNALHRERALSLGVVDEVIDTLPDLEALDGLDMVLLAVPVNAYKGVLSEIKPALLRRGENCILSDVGSVKGPLLNAANDVMGEVPSHWVMGHPIAGSEKHGPDAATPELFQHHKVILTPTETTDAVVLNKVVGLWRQLGANVETMSVKHHDHVLAQTSHLPHLLAYALVSDLSSQTDSRQIFHYAAGGFRDFTRIAASSPAMWHDIFFTNRDSLLDALSSYMDELNDFKTLLETGDSKTLLVKLSESRSARQYFQALLERKRLDQVSSEQAVTLVARSGGHVKGDIQVPGDKSISHRAIMLGALAEGVTDISGFLEGEDSLATLQAFRDMGVKIEGPDNGRVKVTGVGLNGLKAPDKPLYLGNSGTAMRLLAGLLSGQTFSSELMGDASLSSRPMKRVTVPLQSMGGQLKTESDGTPPIRITPSVNGLKGVQYELPMASAQVKSALLLAGLYSQDKTSITEPAPTRDHTERMLEGMGYAIDREGNNVSLVGGGRLQGIQLRVPGDISSAAFFLVAASITPGSDLWIRNVGVNPTRDGIIQLLRLMGGNVEIANNRFAGGEPVADLHVQHAPLKGIDIPEELVPLAIDEFPVLFIAAACAEGVTTLTGAHELRVKESDRIQAMIDGLAAIGVEAQGTPDGAIIPGNKTGKESVFLGGEVNSLGDHRIAMAFAVASLRSQADIRILDCANVATSFPNFVLLANQVGLSIESAVAIS